ncbi:hypothetical protein [Micromonospora sp. 4G55]|uniref:hypothetical protein n=1 Tax=Micromonospora sp. 4G55 TaxID=2806102 RepID=UPI001A443B4B|nr:hypothetical protein [Micromonospora sp. 4G55]MBM0260111.1 hypothetical protein [Micromonospora sp. 4G55]
MPVQRRPGAWRLGLTFYLHASPAEYTDRFGAPPTRRLFALPQHVSPAARAHVDAHARQLLPAEHAATRGPAIGARLGLGSAADITR